MPWELRSEEGILNILPLFQTVFGIHASNPCTVFGKPIFHLPSPFLFHTPVTADLESILGKLCARWDYTLDRMPVRGRTPGEFIVANVLINMLLRSERKPKEHLKLHLYVNLSSGLHCVPRSRGVVMLPVALPMWVIHDSTYFPIGKEAHLLNGLAIRSSFIWNLPRPLRIEKMRRILFEVSTHDT